MIRRVNEPNFYKSDQITCFQEISPDVEVHSAGEAIIAPPASYIVSSGSSGQKAVDIHT